MNRWIKRIVPHSAALAVIMGSLALMAWQLERAEFKTELMQDWNSERVTALSTLGDQPALPQHVTAEGQLDFTRQVLLDNQVRDFQTGVHVFTPLIAEDRIVLVNRGWAAWGNRTDPLPDPGLMQPMSAINAQIRGVLNRPPGVGIQLGQAVPLQQDQWPNLMTYFDVEPLRQVFGPQLASYVIQLEPSHPEHLTGDEWTVVTFGPERHIGYAIQWAAIALVVFLIWVVLSIRQYRRK